MLQATAKGDNTINITIAAWRIDNNRNRKRIEITTPSAATKSVIKTAESNTPNLAACVNSPEITITLTIVAPPEARIFEEAYTLVALVTFPARPLNIA